MRCSIRDQRAGGHAIGTLDDLETHLRAHTSAPFLFVGSGLSRRYLKLPDWDGLLRELASLTGRPYGYFVTAGDGSSPAVASAIAEELRAPWWTDERFAVGRDEFGDTLTSKDGPLKVEVALIARSAMSSVPTHGPLSDELAALREVVVDGVITTNYDPLLETVFSDFHPYIGQDELLFTDPQGVGEIYKIHGDASVPETIVLTQDDFHKFDERNPYLAAKLLTLFVEHPVIFLGYSLRDPDVTSILVSISRVLTKENLARLEGNLILVEWDADQHEPVLDRGIISSEGFSVPVKVLRVADFLGLFQMLGRLEHKFSAAVLRRLKERVYELVLSNQPSDKLFVDNIENAPDGAFDVVMGVGMEARLSDRGYLGIQRIDLLNDVLEPHSLYNARRIVDETLPELLSRPGITPVYRYLREAGQLDERGALVDSADVDPKIRQKVDLGATAFAVPASTKARASRIVSEVDNNLERLIDSQPLSVVLGVAPALSTERLSLDRLRGFLVENRSAFTDGGNDRANWTRLVGWYDYLRNGVAAG